MKPNHLISLLQNDYTTVKITFDGAGRGTRYTYKAPLSANVDIGDYVVVATDDMRLSVGYVAEVDDFPDIDTTASFAYKWIVQKVDLDKYTHQLEVEHRFKKHLRTLQRQQAKTQSLSAFAAQFEAGSTEREELDALIRGDTTIEQLVNLASPVAEVPQDNPDDHTEARSEKG